MPHPVQRLLILSALLLGCAAAQAGLIACPGAIASNVSGTTACQYSTGATQDFLNVDPLTVNAEQFFSFSDWYFAGKIGETSGYAGTGAGDAGSWTIPALAASDVLLVFKSGTDTSLVAYLVASGTLSGSWESPFENPPFTALKNTKEVSHISVYARGETFGVPSPSPLLLIALPLLGLALRRR